MRENTTARVFPVSCQPEENRARSGAFGTAIPRVNVLSAVQAAAQSVRDAIITGKLRPGARLVERDMAGALGIGQPTLREAFKELEFEGFVRKTPRRGTYVSTFTRNDIRDIMLVRIPLEALSVELAAAKMTPDSELQLRELIDQMSAAANSYDLGAFHNADVDFHRQIWAVAGNKYLTKALEGIAFRLFVFGTLSHGRSQFLAAVDQHRGVLAGLCSRDPHKARIAFVSETLKFWNEQDRLDLSFAVSPVVIVHS